MSVMNNEVYKQQVSSVWKATAILAIVTIIEVAIAIMYDRFMHDSGLRVGLNVFMILASLVKAFYIVSIFMHMKYERAALVMTVLMPLFFLIWFIIAFLWEGSSWLDMRSIF